MPKASKFDLKRGHLKDQWQSGPMLAVCLDLVVRLAFVYEQTF